MIQFEVGKSYALHLPAKDGNGNTTFLTDIFTVTRRTPCYLTFSHISSYGTKMPHCRCKIFTSDTRGEFVHATAFFCLYADSYIDDDSQPNENATSEITPASDNNNATASQPAIVTTVQSNTTAQPEIVKFEVGKTYKSVFSQSGYHFRYKFTIIDRKGNYVTVRDEDHGETARRTLHIDNNGVEWVNPRGTYASHKRHVLFADAPTVQPELPATAQSKTTALQKIKCPYDYDISAMSPNTGPITPSAVKKSALIEVLQPESLYMDNSFSDAPGDNSCPDQDIPESHEPDAIPADNPGFTIVPSEHITRPDYATYPESITDECPYTTVYACDFPENHTHAALDHNAAVISSCMFHEAVISMLLKISPAAIIQLGFHMGLFIAKPKGKKISIAEAFAKRLIERRDLHAVKSARFAQHTSINTAGIPDNVKFFETKHRQLAFMFTDELVFTD